MENDSCNILCCKTTTNCKKGEFLLPENAGATQKKSMGNFFYYHNISGKKLSDVEQHADTDTLKVNTENFNASNTNFNNQCAAEYDDLNQAPFTFFTYFWNIFTGFSAGFSRNYAAFENPQSLSISYTFFVLSVSQIRKYREILP